MKLQRRPNFEDIVIGKSCFGDMVGDEVVKYGIVCLAIKLTGKQWREVVLDWLRLRWIKIVSSTGKSFHPDARTQLGHRVRLSH